MSVLRGTPFHSRTAPLCESHEWQRWSGYLTAASYSLNPTWEYHAIRGAAAVIDISPLYKYRLTGPHAERLLNRVVTRDVSRCAERQVRYTPWCDEAGKVLDDGTVQRLGLQEFRLTAAGPNLRWLHENACGLDVDVEDETDRTAALALQGPLSREVLKQLAPDADLDNLRYFWLTRTHIRGVPVAISRTGYTGDLGYEIWLASEHAETVWDSVLQAGAAYRLTPAGNHALGLARIEAGLILIDVDYVPSHKALIDSQKASPFELGLGWTVDLGKQAFVGRRALQAEISRPPAWRFVGLEIDWQAYGRLYAAVGLPPQVSQLPERTSVPLYANGRQIGYATSRCYSPGLKQYIALATVAAAHSRLGSQMWIEVTVEHQRRRVPARVVKTPFFDPPRKRS